MKQNKLLWLCVVICLCLLAGPAATLAAEGGAEGSKVTITLTENDGPTDPVDPEEPKDPGPGPGTGMFGPLSLDYVSPMAFPEIKVSGALQELKSTTDRPYIQVTDNRGTAVGWNVEAELSEFKTTATVGGEPEEIPDSLPGAILTLSSGSALSANQNLTAPYVSQSIELTAGGAQKRVVTADSSTPIEGNTYGAGTGTWVIRWFPAGNITAGVNPYATLSIFGGTAQKGEHEATITWTLSNTP